MPNHVETRRKSPRAPTMALDEALERTLRIYEKDRLHPIPTEIAAKHMGYASANNGSALQCLASLRYYGLLDRPRDGVVAVSKDVEAFKFAPSDDLRKAFLRRFVSTPPLFAELLDRSHGGMPSDESLRYELIQRGFIPASAGTVATVFKRSVEFAAALSAPPTSASALAAAPQEPTQDDDEPPALAPVAPKPSASAASERGAGIDEAEHDRIPVRLSGGRRAWIVVPALFYDRDKERLKAQIDLLLTQDEEEL
ncbi:MAG: hypothetical protein H0X13_13615 [Ramlibacter sp.]|nr:hypothetical protein [Ramlibacter sp.]